MNKVVIAPDSFKGTISAVDFCKTASEVFKSRLPGCEVVLLPMADGGEGTVDCFSYALGGDIYTEVVKGPYMEDVRASLCMLADKTAVVELAATSGLTLCKRREPLLSTTFGFGQLISKALLLGAKKLILGLGGSATNDGGAGMACALGIKFYDASGNEFMPAGGTLGNVKTIDVSCLDKRVCECEIIAMCDVDNKITGKLGASYVFGPQKGADANAVRLLDAGLINLYTAVREQLKVDVFALAGGGAAGGAGAGVAAFLGGDLRPGVDVVAEAAGLDSLLEGCQLVITGEGLMDGQSLHGKTVIGVARHAKKAGVPVIAVVGGAKDEEIKRAYEMGLTAVFTINRLPQPLCESGRHARENLAATLDNICRIIGQCGF